VRCHNFWFGHTVLSEHSVDVCILVKIWNDEPLRVDVAFALQHIKLNRNIDSIWYRLGIAHADIYKLAISATIPWYQRHADCNS